MKFQKALNIWNATEAEIKKLQAGQWVYAGQPENKGRFLGVRKSGSVVVAWLGNEKAQGNYYERLNYIRTLRTYAKAF